MFSTFLQESPLIAILRGITPEEIIPVSDILFNNGIRLLEVPLNGANALECISIAQGHTKGRMLVGAGTVLSPANVVAARDAGATFIISPNTDTDVIRETKKLGLISIPGFLTATEAFTAMKAGADYLKLFPSVLGPGYIKDLKAVIKTPIFAVGGVTKDNIQSFLKVCPGLGIGSAIYKPGKSLEEIERDTRALSNLTK